MGNKKIGARGRRPRRNRRRMVQAVQRCDASGGGRDDGALDLEALTVPCRTARRLAGGSQDGEREQPGTMVKVQAAGITWTHWRTAPPLLELAPEDELPLAAPVADAGFCDVDG